MTMQIAPADNRKRRMSAISTPKFNTSTRMAGFMTGYAELP